MQRRAPNRLPDRIKIPNPRLAQLALEVGNHFRIGRADADCLVNIFFVSPQPLGHIAGLSALVQRRVELLVGEGQIALGPVLRHRSTPVVEQRLAGFRPEHRRLDRRPPLRRLAKRGLHEWRQVGDSHQHNSADALGQNRLACNGALGIVYIAQAHLGQRLTVNRLELCQVPPAGALRIDMAGFRHGGTVLIGIDQRAAQLVQ